MKKDYEKDFDSAASEEITKAEEPNTSDEDAT